MRAVVCREPGPLSDLVVAESEPPPCGPNQIRLRVEAAGVNFVDALFVQGRYQIRPPTPFVPGSEAAGVVTEVGATVEGWALGDRALCNVGLGGFADELVVRPDQAHHVPAGVSAATAAALGQSYCTAWFALHRRAAIRSGEHVLVLGAGGGVGLATIDVAVLAGATVTAVASSPAKRDAATRQGAHHVLDAADDLKGRVRELSGGGADIAVDPVGGELSEVALRSLGDGGRLLVIGFASGEIPRLPTNQVLLRNRAVIGVDWGVWAMHHPEPQRELLSEVMAEVDGGRLHPVEPTTYRLDDAAQALADLEGRRVVGKVVLVP